MEFIGAGNRRCGSVTAFPFCIRPKDEGNGKCGVFSFRIFGKKVDSLETRFLAFSFALRFLDFSFTLSSESKRVAVISFLFFRGGFDGASDIRRSTLQFCSPALVLRRRFRFNNAGFSLSLKFSHCLLVLVFGCFKSEFILILIASGAVRRARTESINI